MNWKKILKDNKWYGNIGNEGEEERKQKIVSAFRLAEKQYEELGKTTNYLTCPRCFGSGKGERQITTGEPGHYTPDCRKCKGKGTVSVPPQPDDDWIGRYTGS